MVFIGPVEDAVFLGAVLALQAVINEALTDELLELLEE